MQRLISIDILKLFAMFLVIWGHCAQFLLTSDYLDEPAYLYIYSFHMPLFMMISGMFVHHELGAGSSYLSHLRCSLPEYGRLLLVRARQLLLPCVAWGVLMSLGNLIQPLINGTHIDKSLLSTFYTNFWFLKALFLCFALWYTSQLLLRRRWLVFVVSIVVSQFITEWTTQWMYPSFALGAYLGSHMDALRANRKRIALVCLTLGGLLLIGWGKQHFLIPSVYRYAELSTPELLHAIGMRLYRYMVNFTLSLGFIALFLGIDHRLSTLNSKLSTSFNFQLSTFNYLAKFGQMTLGIYIIHSLIIIVRERFAPGLLCCDALNPWLFNIVIAPLLSVVLLLVSADLTELIRRLPHLSFFLLGTPWPKRQ